MAIVITDDVLRMSSMSEPEIKVELAAWFYQKKIFTLAQAAKFVDITRLEMQDVLAQRDIHLHISPQDVEDDLDTLKGLNLL